MVQYEYNKYDVTKFMKVVEKSISLLREGDIVSIYKGVRRYTLRKYFLYQGVMTFSIGDKRVELVANDSSVVSITQSRFEEEKYELKSILDEITSNDVFYDIGANTGLYSCFVISECPQCQVIAFEPYPPNVLELKENAEMNDPERISIIDAALSDKSGKVLFSMPNDSNPGHGTSSITEDQTEEYVRSVRGDELISKGKISPPNIVKIDVEGAEPLVIDGIKNVVSKGDCRLVFCELHPSKLSEFDSSTSKIVSQFEEMGYAVRLHSRLGERKVIEARRD